MDVAREAAQRGAPEGTVVVARAQTRGRGRFGRAWLSPPGTNLHLSVLLRPPEQSLPLLSIMGALAVAEVVAHYLGVPSTIKWPNDVRAQGRKIAGVLVESQWGEGAPLFTVLGIGLNVNMDPRSVPEIAALATSLAVEAGYPFDLQEVLEELLQRLDRLYRGLLEGQDLVGPWRALLETLGRQVVVRHGDRIEEGLAEGVDPLGNLLLRRPDGQLVVLNAGEVTSQLQPSETP